MRRLGRDGEGEYRLNGARCRLADVVEVLSDTGLGKEMHSVVSQGRVEAIVLSRPRDRRLLIEEAAGLGKHRKRRRRAQLKLERTAENLSRALDVEREARSRLRPLKRQAEAAELHQRLERQTLEARYELSRDSVRSVRSALAQAEAVAGTARAEREEAEKLLAGVAKRREQAEEAFAALTREREELQARLFAARSARDRIGIRLERAQDQGQAAADGAERRAVAARAARGRAGRAGDPSEGTAERIAALEKELAALDGERDERVRDAIAELEARALRRRRAAGRAGVHGRHGARGARGGRGRRRGRPARARRGREGARGRARGRGAGRRRARRREPVPALHRSRPAPRSLCRSRWTSSPGYELALAAALGPRLGAGVVDSVAAGEAALDSAGEDGGLVIVSGAAARQRPPSRPAPAPSGCSTA